MKRIFVAILTFGIGVSIANAWERALSFDVDDVPAQTTSLGTFEIDESIPKFVPFFDSFAKDEYFYGWFTDYKFKGMDEVWAIQLYLDDHDDQGVKWSAFVRTRNPDYSNSEDTFDSKILTAKDDRLTFTTTRVRGIDYTFEGKFLYGGSDFAQDQKVLKGTLRKRMNGKIVATVRSEFAYAEPRCTQ